MARLLLIVLARNYGFVGELSNVSVDSDESDRFQRSRS
jgi:hypothetical protein